ITFGTNILTSAGGHDVFIVKYDAGGNVLWGKSVGGIKEDVGTGCATDAGGNIITTGQFQSPTIIAGTTTLTNAGGVDFFVIKCDSGGNTLWAKCAGSSGDERGMSCAAEAGGKI